MQVAATMVAGSMIYHPPVLHYSLITQTIIFTLDENKGAGIPHYYKFL